MNKPTQAPSSGEEIHQIWSDVIHLLPENIVLVEGDLVTHLKNSPLPMSSYLLTGSSAIDVKSNDVNSVVDEIIVNNVKGLKFVRNQIIYLSFVIETGNRQKIWSLPLPPVPTFIKREKNPFQPDSFKSLRLSQTWSETVTDSFNQNISFSEQAKVGRILLSSMTRGGLLQINAVETLLKQLQGGLSVGNKRSFIDLSLRWQGHDDMETRRWFPDTLTEVLILQNEVNPSLMPAKNAWGFISSFFKEVGMNSKSRPRNMSALIDAIALGLQTKIPPFLVNYITRKFISHSLKKSAWLRIQGLEHTEFDEGDDCDEEFLFKSNSISNDDYGESTWGKKIKLALRESSKPTALISLCSVKTEISDPPVKTYILGWAKYLIEKGSRYGRSLTLGTVRDYVGRIASRVYGVVGNEDLEKMNVEAFEEIYLQILEDASSVGMRRQLARTLREFHHFLTLKFNAPNLDYSVLGIGNSLSPVDANIISIEEYLETLNILESGDLILIHPDFPLIARIVTTLGFRCGLRRSEVLKLRIIDVHGKVDPEILVRPHATRRLKTKNSTRRILLSCLLEPHELEKLLEWTQKRREEEQTESYSPYLFSIPQKKYAYIPEELLFPAIHRALRYVANDQTLRFHHLRHSCASWNTLRLMIADHGVPNHFFEELPETYKWLKESETFRDALYRQSHPTRKHLYVIASMLGHSSPSMTLEHYIHWCDVISHDVMLTSVKPIESPLWVKITGMPQATVYRQLKHDGEQSLLKSIRKKSSHKTTVIPKDKRKKKLLNQQGKSIKEPAFSLKVEVIWKLINLYSTRSLPMETLAERYGFSLIETKNMMAEATKIAGIKSRDRHASYRHRMLTSESNERLICPRKPRFDTSKLLSSDFINRLLNLFSTDSNNCTWILQYYLNHATTSSNDLVFKKPADATKFLDIVGQLKIPNKFIKVTWLHGKKHKKLSNIERRKYWRDALQLPHNKQLASKKINDVRPLGHYGWISIRLLDYLHDEVKGHSSDGYRFAFIMFAIAHSAKLISKQ